MLSVLSQATAQASLAQGYASAASSVVQQDLSGVNSAALHRSPNAVTALFVYDTSKDSDGGAWTEKCQHTSWYNEAINGKWLGAEISELYARYTGATLGAELVGDSELNNPSYWVVGIYTPYNFTITGGQAIRQNNANAASIPAPINLTAGKTYRVRVTLTLSRPSIANATAVNYGSVSVAATVAGNPNNVVSATKIGNPGDNLDFYITPTVNTNMLRVFSNTNSYTDIEAVSVREVTAQTAQSGDYFQLSTDGKFYRLWKNLLQRTNEFNHSYWGKSNTAVAANTIAGPDGVVSADTLTANTANNSHNIGSSVFAASSEAQKTFSVYAKTNGYPAIRLTLSDSGGQSDAYFNISTGATGFVSAGALSSITSIGGGWYRCSITRTMAGTSGYATIWLATGTTNAGSDWYFTGDGVSGVHLRDAQVEYGSTATAYEAKTAEGSISEVFRGNKRDFPRLAGIVAEASNVTIYDLTEKGANGSCPMWMRFINGSTSIVSPRNQSGSFQSVGAFNATLVLGTVYGITVANFASERIVLGALGDGYQRYVKYPAIALRNTGGIYGNSSWAQPYYTLNGDNTNAVAMTVLPDAPVDPVTGLKVPTIAVATSGGVSVIKHNGTAISPFTGVSIDYVEITKDYRLRIKRSGLSAIYVSSDWRTVTTPTAPLLLNGTSQVPNISNTNFTKGLSAKLQSLMAWPGEIALLQENPGSYTKGVTTRVANTFNTGHMTGDIRRAYLADVDAGSVSSAELVTNGTFDTDASGWVLGSNASWSGGSITVNGSGTALRQDNKIVAGRRYKVSITTTVSAGSFAFYPGNVQVSNPIGTVEVVITAANAELYVYANAGTVGTIDNISIKEVVADRSYKAKGANIAGTLTKSQVASAAQLVAYSGFSAANYLREPYSADLDFGTGEWSVGAWVNLPVSLPANSLSSFGTTGNSLISSDLSGALTLYGAGSAVVTQPSTIQFNGDSAVGWGTTVGSAGRAYRFTVTLSGSGSVKIVYRDAAVGGPYLGDTITLTSTPTQYTLNFVFLAGSTDRRVGFQWAGAAATVTATGISLFELAPSVIAERAFSSGPKVAIAVTGAGLLTATAFDGTTTRTVTTTAAYNTGTWLKAEADYTTDGTLSISVNGVEVAATRGNPLLSLNNSNAVLTIGNSYNLDAPFPGSIALLKLSATVPTAEQSVWMYEQEKQMFREGAQVCLPDAGAIVDLTYDDATDKWIAISATNESEWSGLIRTSVTASPAGSYSKASSASGVQLLARTTTNPGVDVTIPSYGLREELVKRSESAAKLNARLATFDYVGGFTANTTSGSTAITSASGLTYPTSYIGARISGSGIPANTFVVAVSGTTIYISAAATATASSVQISFIDFILPVGYEARVVQSSGQNRTEGSTKDYIRLFDGFKETIRFNTAPGYTAAVQIQAGSSQ